MGNEANEIASIKAQLKRQSWLLRLSAVVWLGGLAFFLFNGAYESKVVENLRVKRLAIIDANGDERMLLYANENSTPTTKDVLLHGKLGFVDDNGKERLLLDMNSDYVSLNGKDWPRKIKYSGILFKDVNGDETGGIGTNQNGNISLNFDSKINITPPPPYEWLHKSDRLSIYADHDGRVGLDFTDLDNHDERMSITSEPDNSVAFTLRAPDGTQGCQDETCKGTVKISGKVDANGTATWTAPNN